MATSSFTSYRSFSSVQVNVEDPHADPAKKARRDSSGQVELLTSDGPPPLKKFLWWKMTKRQRILAIVGLVLLLLLVIFLIVWFVVIPAVIQHYANSVKMALNYMDVVAIPNYQTLTVDLSLHVQHDVGIGASTDAATATLIYSGAAFGTLPFPSLEIRSGSQSYNLTIANNMTIMDQAVFNAMADAMMTQPEIVLSASASLDVHALGVTFEGVSFDRDLAVEGFTGFSDPEPVVESMQLTTCTLSKYVLDTAVALTNTARMGLEGIGALNMSVYYGQQYLGYALSKNATLGIPRGASNQKFLVTVDASAVSITNMVLAALAGASQFYITGDNPYVTTHGQFEEALHNVNISVPSGGGTFFSFGEGCTLASLMSS